MRVILAAGGSGGHIFPSIALAEALREKGVEDVYCVASSRRLDRNILEGAPYRCFFLSANPMPRKFSPVKTAVFLSKLAYDVGYSLSVLVRVRPSVLVGFGGYSSGAISVMSKLLGIPLIIHEQNLVPGRANRILSRVADRIAVSFRDSAGYFGRAAAKTVYTGNPLRTGMLTNDRGVSAKRLGIAPDKMTVLVMGGSQGSSFLNNEVSAAAKRINSEKRGEVQFIHLTGADDHNKVAEFYSSNGIPGRVVSFLERIDDAYACSDIAVSRSGAAAVFELAYYEKPMILIPYPNPGNNQRTNAAVFSRAGAAIYREEKDLTSDSLYKDMILLLEDKDKRKAMSEAAGGLKAGGAADSLAEEVIKIATRNTPLVAEKIE